MDTFPKFCDSLFSTSLANFFTDGNSAAGFSKDQSSVGREKRRFCLNVASAHASRRLSTFARPRRRNVPEDRRGRRGGQQRVAAENNRGGWV